MSTVNLKKFVDIDIQKHITSVISGTRDTVVLITNEGSGDDTIYSSYSEASAALDSTIYARTLAYLKVFFDNGGIKVLVHIDTAGTATTIGDYISTLDNKYIIVAFAGASSESIMPSVALSRASNSSIYGINEKILLSPVLLENIASMTSSIKNLACKVSSVIGAEMTIAAYLSKINVYKVDSIYDYAFTAEVLTEEAISDAQYDVIIANNLNVDIDLANNIRNVGGNCKDGAELTNNYVRIVLHQTLTDRLLDVLVQKIKNSSGLGKIYSMIVQELQAYKANGYLTSDEVWSDDDLVISYNDTSYTIIEKGTPLINGYSIKILPLSSLSAQDKALHKTPPIYIILADQYGIRQITVNGEII